MSADAVDTLASTYAEVISRTSDHVRDRLAGESTGHDWWHAERVRKLAERIAEAEGADVVTVQLAALLHDVADHKFSGSVEDGPRAAREWLESLDLPDDMVDGVARIIALMSFRGAGVPEQEMSLEGRCVRDADRLDAMGAIGVARTFAYGGFVRRPLHDPSRAVVLHQDADLYRSMPGTTVNHFHEKLLLLQDRLSTATARRLGMRRHQYLVDFLAAFEQEWVGSDLDG